MENKLIVAAAGSGKTTYLINQALQINDARVLITTYTEANEREIKNKFIEINGFIPHNVFIQTWFSFLLQHGVRPYQSAIYEGNVKGLLLVNQKSGVKGYSRQKQPFYYGEKDLPQYYFSNSMLIYSDKISKFACRANELTGGLIIDRICRIYSYIFIDEVQDLAGYDLELVRLLLGSTSKVLLVGDPRQVTYHTHDETKFKKYSDGRVSDFITEQYSDCNVEIDNKTLNTTLHIPDWTCHVHGENPPLRRRFSATSPEKVARAKEKPHTVRSTHEMCDFNTGGPGNDGLPKDSHVAQQGMQPA